MVKGVSWGASGPVRRAYSWERVAPSGILSLSARMAAIIPTSRAESCLSADGRAEKSGSMGANSSAYRLRLARLIFSIRAASDG